MGLDTVAARSVLLVGGCGYIGSYLYPRLLRAGYRVTVVDALHRSNPANIPVSHRSYQDLTIDELRDVDVVLWFAGHSSVLQSMEDPIGALSNNCMDLYALARKLPAHAKLIYASTASLYSMHDANGVKSSETSLINIPEQNAYDSSKFAFDYIAKNYLKNCYGIRMGTLAGYSQNLRPELVFNAMNLSACQTGIVRLKNSETWRTILYLKDLWIFIKNLLQFDHHPGFYNAGSFTGTMADLAIGIARTWGAKIQYEGDSSTYSFALECSRMQAICGFDLKSGSLEENCRAFIQEFEGTRYAA